MDGENYQTIVGNDKINYSIDLTQIVVSVGVKLYEVIFDLLIYV